MPLKIHVAHWTKTPRPEGTGHAKKRPCHAQTRKRPASYQSFLSHAEVAFDAASGIVVPWLGKHEGGSMFSHVMVGANDISASKQFYDATLGTLGVSAGKLDPKGRVVYSTPKGIFMVTKPINGEPAKGANGGTIGFAATSTDQINAWHAAGVANQGTSCEDPPGERGGYYLAYLRDPSGNKVCALFSV